MIPILERSLNSRHFHSVDSHHINPHFIIPVCQQPLNRHSCIQGCPVGLVVMVFFHKLVSGNQNRPWVPGFLFAAFDGIQAGPAAIRKFADYFILAPAPSYPSHTAISQTYRQPHTRLRKIYLFALIFNSTAHNKSAISCRVSTKFFI